MFVVWQQPRFIEELIRCRDCNTRIFDGEIIHVEQTDATKLFAEGEGNSYTQRATCTRCAINDSFTVSNNLLASAVKELVADSLKESDSELSKNVRGIIREELKRILKEEAFDPGGTFSPE